MADAAAAVHLIGRSVGSVTSTHLASLFRRRLRTATAWVTAKVSASLARSASAALRTEPSLLERPSSFHDRVITSQYRNLLSLFVPRNLCRILQRGCETHCVLRAFHFLPCRSDGGGGCCLPRQRRRLRAVAVGLSPLSFLPAGKSLSLSHSPRVLCRLDVTASRVYAPPGRGRKKYCYEML